MLQSPPCYVGDMSSEWKQLLADPGPDGHVVQLYQDADFYGEAISHFTAEGLVRGESVILVATPDNWHNISSRLTSKSFDVPALMERGQLTLLDAIETLPKFMKRGTPDGSVFKPLARDTIRRARQGGRFPAVRWWGEMVNVLYVEGREKASNQLEQFFDEISHEETIPIFCSFLMDKYDPAIYDEAFAHVCHTHSNVIHAEDYVSHRAAVNQAITKVIGPIQGPLLRSLVAWSHQAPGMSPSQAMLLWVKDTMPRHFAEVLAVARAHDHASSAGSNS
jgi:hypothetical protein